MTRKTKTWITGAICALAVAGVAPAAWGQTASQQGYDESGVLAGVDQGGGGSSPASVNTVSGGSEGSSLPFTGLDIGIMLALGGTAAGAGFVMRRAARNPAA
jgi:hypothetical protein